MANFVEISSAWLVSALLCLVAAASSLAQTAPVSSPPVGPSFTCAPGQDPVAQIICSDRALSRTDLLFTQAYEALRQQLDAAGKTALWQEEVAFHTAVLAGCALPPSGPLPTISPDAVACVTGAYEQRRSKWLAQLSGPALEEANRPIEDHIAAQRNLQALGFLPASEAIDGVYGPATRAAITAFQLSEGQDQSGLMADRDANALRIATSARNLAPASNRSRTEATRTAVASLPDSPAAHAAAALKAVTLARQMLAQSEIDAGKAYSGMSGLRIIARYSLGCGVSSDNECVSNTAVPGLSEAAVNQWNILMIASVLQDLSGVADISVPRDIEDEQKKISALCHALTATPPLADEAKIEVARAASVTAALDAKDIGDVELQGWGEDVRRYMGEFQVNYQGALAMVTVPGFRAAKSLIAAADLLNEVTHEVDLATASLPVPSGEILAHQPIDP